LGFPASLAAQAQFQTYPRFNFSTVASLGKLTSSEIRRVTDNYTETGTLTWTRGSHEFKFGGEYRLPQFNDIQIDDPAGNYNFSQAFTSLNPFASSSTSGNDVASFLLGVPSSGTMGQALYLALQRRYVASFVQDRWKVTRTLTLNLGFRYEIEYPPTERHNYQSYFDFNAMAPLVQQAGLSTPGALVPATAKQRSPENTYYRQFGPRFGYAWQATPKTVLRGGYGILWLPGGIEITGGSSNNPTASISTALVSSLDNGVTPFARLSNPFPQGLIAPGNAQGLNSLIGQGITAYNLGQHSGYTQQWNFDIQRQITTTLAADIAYAGSHSLGLPASLQIDQLPDKYLSLGTALTQQVTNPFYGLISVGALAQPTVARGQLLRPYPQFNGVTLGYTNLGNSIYHSLQTKVTKRFSRSLLSLAYTFSKGIGNSEAATGYLEQNGVPGFQNNNNIRMDRSLNAQDSPHRVLVAFTTELPAGKGQRWLSGGPAAINSLVSGWEANGLYTYETGQPLFLGTSTNLTNSFGGGSRPNNNGTSALLTTPAESRLDQWFNTSVFSQPPAFTFGNAGRALPDVRNDKTNNLDLGIAKNNRFFRDGRVNLQFRAEFFNALNHVRFRNPGLTFGTPQFGIVSGQVNEPRKIQLALKLIY
ncbi:MAG TPA: TonB-dependent receptor, partial [Bryobacteraceae bacterium]|nr:TonB-dependent receptor [Bryobacteraceae bacterium]